MSSYSISVTQEKLCTKGDNWDFFFVVYIINIRMRCLFGSSVHNNSAWGFHRNTFVYGKRSKNQKWNKIELLPM